MSLIGVLAHFCLFTWADVILTWAEVIHALSVEPYEAPCEEENEGEFEKEWRWTRWSPNPQCGVVINDDYGCPLGDITHAGEGPKRTDRCT